MPDSRDSDPVAADLTAPIAPARSNLAPIDSLPFTVSLRRVNLGVGYTAACLPLAVWLPGFLLGTCAQNNGLDSISHYYYSPIGGDLFVGALFLIGMLMLFFFTVPDAAVGVEAVSQVDEYRRFSQRDLRLAQIAGAMAFLIALMPTNGSGCSLSDDTMRAFYVAAPGSGLFRSGTQSVNQAVIGFDLGAISGIPFTALIHSLAAGVMFSILGYFSLFVFTRVQSAKSMKTATSTGFKKKMRNVIYVTSGITIFAAVFALIFKYAACIGAKDCSYDASNFTFWAEAIALLAFGFSWLTKGRFIGWLADEP
ncbi:hypothetical protein [Puniceibacterium sediminis]|uniref:Uncharacterized protein n=1 Tax=Puniceibacterium sediminis TaxID=1608407 RepID=A0A238UV93_9RHOB|nr:hypothetical protein [Puniceibacterium sediminis]SNR25794.1 hypothetical protein SAMN06265370_101150 [Puniceibacterium sediminis]